MKNERDEIHAECPLPDMPTRETAKSMLKNVVYQSVREKTVLQDMIDDCLDKLGFKKEDL